MNRKSYDNFIPYKHDKFFVNLEKGPVMTTMDGSTFPAGPFMTTTDALQLTSYYCQDNFDWNPKPMTHCQKPDLLGVYRPLFLDRVCDGRIDCEGREKI